jgi:hypothetical protein
MLAIAAILAPEPKAATQELERSVTITLQQASTQPLTLSEAELYAGEWEVEPLPGTVIDTYESSRYIMGTDDVSSLGGRIEFAPAAGGMIILQIEWSMDGRALCSAETNSVEDLAVQTTLMNTDTLHPTCSVEVISTR